MEEWQQILKDSLKTPEEIADYFSLDLNEVRKVDQLFQAQITPYYAGLIKQKKDGLWRQIVPDIAEVKDTTGVLTTAMSILFSNKQPQTWVIDGRVHMLFPDKVQEDIASFVVTLPNSEDEVGYTVEDISADTYCLYYLNFAHDLNIASRIPLLVTDADALQLKPIEFAKFPSVTVDKFGTVHLTYWTNVDSDGEPAEPFDDATGEVSEAYTRAMYYTKGTQHSVLTTYGGEGAEVAGTPYSYLMYIFSSPVQVYKPAMWNSADAVEPVIDVHTGAGGGTSFLQFTPVA